MSMHAKQEPGISRQKSSETATTSETAKATKSISTAVDAQQIPAWAMAWGDGLPPGLMLQTKLTMNQPGDVYEQEADQVAEQVMRTPGLQTSLSDDQEQAKNALMRKQSAEPSADAPGVPPIVHDMLNSGGGQPLDATTRAFMEPRFGHDFSRVRMHTDAKAAESAQSVSALAYTAGSDVVFGSGQYKPETVEGQKLLAHELTHVVQQASGVATGRIQAKPGDKKPASGPKGVPFKLKVDHYMDAGELVHEFVKQYYGYTTEAEIQTKLSLWAFKFNPTTPKEVAQGFVMVTVNTHSQTSFDTLDPKEKEAVNKETDKRFWESTGYKPGQKLGTSAKDKEMAQVWKGVRNAVLTEDKQRKDIEALPEDIKQVLFAGGADASAISPDDYTQTLRIAHKLASLSPEARQDYLSRINASTTSLSDLETSINSYIQLQAKREKQSEETETAARPLLGIPEDLYQRYRDYKLYKDVDLGPGAARADQELVEDVKRETETALLKELKQKDFKSIESFEAALEAYRIAFRTQAVNLALDVLARYDHMLFEEKKKYQNPAAVASLYQGVSQTQASAYYKKAGEKSMSAGVSAPPAGAGAPQPQVEALLAEAREAHEQGEAEVIRGSGNDPLVAARGTDREKLAGLDPAGMKSYLLETIDKRAEESHTARQEFLDDPDRVFKLPDLISASQQIQGIDAKTIYGKIISDYIEDKKAEHLLSQIAIGILAIALAVLVPGGGWLAAAALVANAGISTYQAYAAYKEYEEQERDYNLRFLSEEPSLLWVGVAIAAAALDLGMATSAVVKESATALKALQKPLLDFSKGGELAELVSKIEAADGLNVKVKAALEREAAASEAAEEALKDLKAAAGRTYAFIPGVPDPGLVKQGFRALYYQVKRGVNTIARLRADAKFVEAIGDITRMSGAERAELETAFDEVKQLVKAGQARSMDDASLLDYIDRWAINRSKPGFQAKLFDEMKAWKPLTAEQQRALNALNAQKRAVTTLYEQKAVAEEELAMLRAKPDQSAEDIVEIRELEKELSRLDPVAHPPKKQEGIGKIAEAEKTLADKEMEAARAELTLYDRLRAAAPSDAASERALKGITTDQVGPLKTRPTPLQVEHIVSVSEVADMDGFADLLWKDQKAIVDMKENLIAMDGAANASKGDRTWRSWNQASNFYEPDTIAKMARREADVRVVIEAEIQKRLPKPTATRP